MEQTYTDDSSTDYDEGLVHTFRSYKRAFGEFIEDSSSPVTWGCKRSLNTSTGEEDDGEYLRKTQLIFEETSEAKEIRLQFRIIANQFCQNCNLFRIKCKSESLMCEHCKVSERITVLI